MLFKNTLTYGILGVLGFFSLISTVSEGKNIFSIIVLNVILGGVMYIAFNCFGINIDLNYITGVCIGALGVPGVLLVVILKMLFSFAI